MNYTPLFLEEIKLKNYWQRQQIYGADHMMTPIYDSSKAKENIYNCLLKLNRILVVKTASS